MFLSILFPTVDTPRIKSYAQNTSKEKQKTNNLLHATKKKVYLSKEKGKHLKHATNGGLTEMFCCEETERVVWVEILLESLVPKS